MKIWLAALDAYGGGGITTHLISLTSGLQDQGHEVKWITPGQGTLATIADITLQVIRTVYQPYPNHLLLDMIETWASRLEFNSLLELEKECPDLIHCHDIISFNRIYPIARQQGIPIVLTVHGYIPEEEVRNGHMEENSPEHLYLQELERSALREADRVFAVGVELKDYLTGVQKDAAIKVIPNLIHESFLNVKDRQKRESLGLPENAFLVFCPSRFSFNKGVEHLIEALSQLPQQVFLLLIDHGNVELYTEIEKWKVKDRCRVIKPVPHEEMSSLYAAADVCVIPSVKAGQSRETSSYSAIESMLMGTPVIASCIGGLKEVVGHYGILVPERDPNAITEAIYGLMGKDEHKHWSSLANKRGETFLSKNMIKDIVLEYEITVQQAPTETKYIAPAIPYGISAQVLNLLLLDRLKNKTAKEAFLLRVQQECDIEYIRKLHALVNIINKVIKEMKQ